MQQSQSETLENPQPVEKKQLRNSIDTSRENNNTTNTTLNVDVNDYTSSPTKIEVLMVMKFRLSLKRIQHW